MGAGIGSWWQRALDEPIVLPPIQNFGSLGAEPAPTIGLLSKCGTAPGAPLKVLLPEDSHHHGPERAGKFGLPTFVCFRSKAPFDTARSDLPP